MTTALLGYLTYFSSRWYLVMATVASFYVNRLRNRPPMPFGEEIGERQIGCG